MNTINRDNYDTWLMLYLDNELTAAERAAVEAFAGKHPDVQEELNGLKETILQPETPVGMPGIERLLRPELWNEEALTSVQEKLLLLTDNELTAEEKADLQETIENNPLLEKEWILLQKTKSVTEAAGEMPGKEKLYRSTPLKIIPIGRILKFAVAAAILGFGWFFVANMNNSLSDDVSQPLVETKITNPAKEEMVKNNSHKVEGVPEQVVQKVTEEIATNNNVDYKLPKRFIQDEINKTLPELNSSNKEMKEGFVMKETNENQANTVRDMAVVLPSVKYVDVSGIEVSETSSISNLDPIAVATLAADAEKEPIVSRQEIISADELAEDETINIAGAKINKQKVRNLYRNVTRPIARTIERNNIFRSEDTNK
jgi:anti-sigma factor RsiW